MSTISLWCSIAPQRECQILFGFTNIPTKHQSKSLGQQRNTDTGVLFFKSHWWLNSQFSSPVIIKKDFATQLDCWEFTFLLSKNKKTKSIWKCSSVYCFLPTEANGGPVKRKGQGQSRGLAVAETRSQQCGSVDAAVRSVWSQLDISPLEEDHRRIFSTSSVRHSRESHCFWEHSCLCASLLRKGWNSLWELFNRRWWGLSCHV